jgi:hypothetical protein
MKYDDNRSIESVLRFVALAEDVKTCVVETISGEPDETVVDEALQSLMLAAEDMHGTPVTYRFGITDGTRIKITFLVETE